MPTSVSQSVSQLIYLAKKKNSILAIAKKTHKSITCRKKQKIFLVLDSIILLLELIARRLRKDRLRSSSQAATLWTKDRLEKYTKKKKKKKNTKANLAKKYNIKDLHNRVGYYQYC